MRAIATLTVDPDDPALNGFPHIRQIIRITRNRTVRSTGSSSQETVYAITSRGPALASPADLAQATRDHWSIENNVHWRRDTRFAEDANRTRIRHSPVNLACLRNWAISAINGLAQAPKRFADRCRKLRWGVDIALGALGVE